MRFLIAVFSVLTIPLIAMGRLPTPADPVQFNQWASSPAQLFQSSRPWGVSQVVLTKSDGEGGRESVCAAFTSGNQDLVPSFAMVATRNHQSEFELVARPCAADELEEIKAMAKQSFEKVEVAALPAVVVAGLSVCALGGLVGVTGGMMRFMAAHTMQMGADLKTEDVIERSFYTGAALGVVGGLAAKSKGFALGTAAVVGASAGVVAMVCEGLVHAGSYMGLNYLVDTINE